MPKHSTKSGKRGAGTGVTLKAEATARAEAKASYKRKVITTREIPPDVTRARNVAWLDAISPLTEWMGLKGDALRHKRDILRLQRDDVLDKIVTSAVNRIGRHDRVVRPIPNKFLVPFLEQASLEDPESPLTELWSGLLASAAEDYNPYYTHFVSIISRISAKQARLLEQIMIDCDYDRDADLAHVLSEFTSRYSSSLRYSIARPVKDCESNKLSSFDVMEHVKNILIRPGVEIKNLLVGHATQDMALAYGSDHKKIDDDDFVDPYENMIDHSILVATGLMEHVFDTAETTNNIVINYEYYVITELGIVFSKACQIGKLGWIRSSDFYTQTS